MTSVSHLTVENVQLAGQLQILLSGQQDNRILLIVADRCQVAQRPTRVVLVSKTLLQGLEASKKYFPYEFQRPPQADPLALPAKLSHSIQDSLLPQELCHTFDQLWRFRGLLESQNGGEIQRALIVHLEDALRTVDCAQLRSEEGDDDS